MIGSVIISLALASSIIAMVMYFLNYRGYNNAFKLC